MTFCSLERLGDFLKICRVVLGEDGDDLLLEVLVALRRWRLVRGRGRGHQGLFPRGSLGGRAALRAAAAAPRFDNFLAHYLSVGRLLRALLLAASSIRAAKWSKHRAGRQYPAVDEAAPPLLSSRPSAAAAKTARSGGKGNTHYKNW